jgi:hypothetical protein
MTTVPSTAVSVQRLAGQLHQLSELAEALTFRLLELEERFEAHEVGFRSLVDGAGRLGEGMADAVNLRMGDTEERLARIEAVLKGLERPAAARHLHTVQPPVLQQEPLAAPMARPLHPRSSIQLHEHQEEGEQEGNDNPFLEEGEQTFMDELTA